MKILITNQHTGNFGDDAAGVALALQLRQQFPNAELHFVYNWHPKTKCFPIPFSDNKAIHHTDLIIRKIPTWYFVRYLVNYFFPFIKWRHKLIKRYLDLVRQSDFVIVSPCGLNIGPYKDWDFLFRVFVAVLENKKPIFHLNSIGKSKNFMFNCAAKYTLKRSQVFVREKRNFNELKRWGICSTRGVDTAFSLPSDEYGASNKDITEGPYLAFIPTRIGKWHPNFREVDSEVILKRIILPSIVEISQEIQYKILILPHLYGVLKEEKLLEEIYKRLSLAGNGGLGVTLVDDVKSFRSYERYIANASLVVSMRYHGVVFSIKNAVPFLSLAYENKMKEACDYSGMSDFNFDVTDPGLRRERLVETAKTLKNNRDTVCEKMQRRAPALVQLSRLPVISMSLDWVE